MSLRHVTEAQIEGRSAAAGIVQFEWSGGFEFEAKESPRWRLDLSINPRSPTVEARLPGASAGASYRRLGSFIAIPPGQALQLRASVGPGESVPIRQKSIVCCIDAPEVDRWMGDSVAAATGAVDVLALRNQNLRGLLMRIANELENQGPASVAVVEATATLVAIELSRHLLAAMHAPPRGGLAARRLRMIDERAAAPGPAPSIPELADLCKLSARQLMRAFQTSRGVTLGAHIQAARLAKAERMLMDGAPIKEVAHCLGFASSASFCTTFKRLVGVPPGEYRRRT